MFDLSVGVLTFQPGFIEENEVVPVVLMVKEVEKGESLFCVDDRSSV